MIRLLVVDDHPVVLAGLVRLFDSDDQIDVVGSTGDADAAVDMDASLATDVVLMDLIMPGMGGTGATRRIVTARPDARVLIVSGSCTPESVLGAFDAGAIGYMLKEAEPGQLIAAVHSAAAGGAPMDPDASAIVLQDWAVRQHSVHLSPRELEVLTLVSSGLLNKQIARAMGISEKTVKAHLGHVYEQLGVSRRTDAVHWAREHELLDPDGVVKDPGPTEGLGS